VAGEVPGIERSRRALCLQQLLFRQGAKTLGDDEAGFGILPIRRASTHNANEVRVEALEFIERCLRQFHWTPPF
jgi:hypothetical protein